MFVAILKGSSFSDISIVILKNLIFNENEIKSGRILTFFPTKTIQVMNFSKHANDEYKLNEEKISFYYCLCRLRGRLVNYWWQTHLKNILLIKNPGILIGITIYWLVVNSLNWRGLISDSPQCPGGLRSSCPRCSLPAPGPSPTSRARPGLGCWATRYLCSRTPTRGEQLSSSVTDGGWLIVI